MNPIKSPDVTIGGQEEALHIADEAGKLAAILFNTPGGHTEVDHSIVEEYHTLMDRMSSYTLDQEMRRTIWGHYGEIFTRSSNPCKPPTNPSSQIVI